MHATGPKKYIKGWLQALPWAHSTLVAHNAQFDAAILQWHYGITPKDYFCTMMGSRPYIAPYTASVALATCSKFLNLGEKGDEVIRASGMRMRDFSVEQMADYMSYCRQDVDLTVKLYDALINTYDLPADEQKQIGLTVDKVVNPQLHGDKA